MRTILVMACVLFSITLHAGVSDSVPEAKALSKIVSVPVAGNTKMSLADYTDMWKEANPGSKQSWSKKGDKWLLTIEYRDKNTQKKQKLVQVFDIEDGGAFLETMVGEGQELPPNVVGAMVMSVWSGSSKSKSTVQNNTEIPRQEIKPAPIPVKKSESVEDKKKSEAEAFDAKLKLEKAEDFKKKIGGAHCGNDSKVTFEASELGKVKFAVAGPKCHLSSREFAISSFSEVGSVLTVNLGESCTMQIRPDGQQYKSGRTGIQLGVDCDGTVAEKIFGCNYGELITSWTPCKSIEGWSDLFN